MRNGIKVAGKLVLAIALVAGLSMMVVPNVAVAKGKPKPPPCDCPPTIELPNGTVCELTDCGSDCVYVCPFPF